MKKNKILLLIILLILTFSAAAQNYPEIKELKSKNILFSQYQDEISISNINIKKGIPTQVNFYEYTVQNSDNIFTISSRCCLIYDTIATANNIEDSSTNIQNKKIILPTVQGIFIPVKPENSMEILLYEEYKNDLKASPLYFIKNRQYYFLQGQRFTPAQRAFFVDAGMKYPLEESVLTSSFGMRISPISGKWKFHNGIDLAAPLGTPVYACKNGTISKIVLMDPTYGNYIVINHSNGMTSLYAHLSEILVTKGQDVRVGHTIGKVGTTGASTGPHLHFEISINNKSTNPEDIIK